MRAFKKLFPRACAVIAFILLTNWVITLGYEDWDEPNVLSRRERTELKGTIDTLYVGSSVVYYGYNWEILDEALGTNSFNLGTSRQPLIGSYYLLRETAEENPVKQIYVGLSVSSLKRETKDSNYFSVCRNFRTLRWRLRYVLSVGRESVAMNGLFYATRLEEYDSLQQVADNISHKLSPGEWPEDYGGRGLRLKDKTYKGEKKGEETSDANYWDGGLGIGQADEEALEYLRKIGEFCQENGIELIFTVMPVTQDLIDLAGDLDAFDETCRTLAQECGAQYYNFLLYKERQEAFSNDAFGDRMHLNVTGAETFSSLLAQIRLSDDPDSYFYDSMEEFTQETGA